jgi:hypothetical protein
MTALALLRAPSANRVYTGSAGTLTRAEARWVLGTHLSPDGDPEIGVEERDRAGVGYLDVTCGAPTERVLPLLATLSATWAAFAPQGEELLRPVPLPTVFHHGSELETTLRYPGKTNEQFTALLLNLAAGLSTRRAGMFDGTLSVLDPMCGRGTTLSRVLRLGLSPVGADVDRKDLEAYRGFLLGWAKDRRLKHTSSQGRLSRDKKVLGTRFEAEFARDKAHQRAGKVQTVSVLGCDTLDLDRVLPAGGTDALVCDLPYGVQHGARGHDTWRRSPVELLTAGAAVWRGLLRRGGGMALAVNRLTAPLDEVAAVLRETGFVALDTGGEFRHRVDHSIDRDVVLAVRDDHPERDRLEALAARLASSPNDHSRPRTRARP